MKIEQILNLHRDNYLKYFKEEIKKCKGSSEVLLEMKNKDCKEIYRLYRFDCIEKKEDGTFGIIEFNFDSYLNHESLNFNFHNLNIEINPFFWNGCEIYFKNQNCDFNRLEKWTEKWIDINDEKININEKEVAELIHNVQPPNIENDNYCIAIDFGTAKVEAILDLFIVFKNIGIKEIILNSKSMM